MFEIANTELSTQEIYELYHECEFFSETGTLPSEAKLRTLIKNNGLEDNFLTINMFSGLVYRALAQKHMEVVKLLK